MISAGPSGFYHAPATKGILLTVGGLSLLSSLLQMKTDFHLQLVPHLTTHYQFWRLITSHFAFSNSTEVLFGGFIFYHLRVIERLYGSGKYTAFLLVTVVMVTLLELAALVSGHTLGLNVIPAGPFGVLFAALYQYSSVIPSTYEFKVFGVVLTDKIYMYILAFQLIWSQSPGSIVAAACGWMAGALYRADVGGLRRWRFPPSVANLATKFVLPIFSSAPAIRSTATTFEHRAAPARPPSGRAALAMREYIDAIASGGAPQGSTPRPPSEEHISTLLAIFPRATQEDAIAALNSTNNNMDGAVQYLLDRTTDSPAPASNAPPHSAPASSSSST
ncbi:hypothetical protein DFQ27_003664 [Actinomortierella ambigua]|uniref:UBA domain-containing protein n=1 Tax=Actinomortierella ambigua TaxID=1343610 RepID=A0A9P6Q640_9FUNG|nr:hypothetical protein DFQ27_003664 [Actinomortierella ambigua]